ncbi:hypothetical protein [Methylomonas sp. MgM2]
MPLVSKLVADAEWPIGTEIWIESLDYLLTVVIKSIGRNGFIVIAVGRDFKR